MPLPASPRWSHPLLWLGAFLALGVGLRVADVLDRPLWGDEFYTVTNGRTGLAGGSADPAEAFQLAWSWRTMPLWQLVTETAFRFGGPSVAVARVVPLAAGLLALLLLPWLAARWWDRRLGACLFACLALSPRAILIGQWARYESPAFLFGGLALLGFAQCFSEDRTRRHRAALLGGSAGSLAVGLHVTALVPLVLAALGATACRRSRPLLRWAVALLLGSIVLAALPVLRQVGSDFGSRADLAARYRWLLAAAYDHGPVFAGLAVLGWGMALRRGVRGERMLALLLVGTLVVFVVASAAWTVGLRYLASVEAGIPLLAAYALARSRLSGRALLAVLAVASAIQAPLLLGNLRDGQRYDYAAVAAALRPRLQAGDRILADHHATLREILGGDRPEGVELRELPDTLGELERITAEPRQGRDWLVVLRQRGRWVIPEAPRFESWLGERGGEQQRFGHPRPDARLYDFAVGVVLLQPIPTNAPH